MRALSLFTGAGGMDLAAEAAGIQVVGQCEIDPACNRVLAHRWPDVPKWKDVRTLTVEDLKKKGVMQSGIDLVFGGFP